MRLQERKVDDLLAQQEIHALGSMMRDREAERTRIARDLHDRLGGMLSAAKFQFSALGTRMDLPGSDQSRQYQKGLDLLDQAVDEVRRISRELSMATSSRFGLKDALADLQAGLRSLNIVNVEMSFHRVEEGLDQRFEIVVYRIVQHCISNVLKHARATTVSVQFTRGPASINLLVEDDGRGFDPSSAGEGGGVARLRQSTAELGGTVNIDSRPGRGTTVSIDIPLIKSTENDS